MDKTTDTAFLVRELYRVAKEMGVQYMYCIRLSKGHHLPYICFGQFLDELSMELDNAENGGYAVTGYYRRVL